jgi:hypothetical protein
LEASCFFLLFFCYNISCLFVVREGLLIFSNWRCRGGARGAARRAESKRLKRVGPPPGNAKQAAGQPQTATERAAGAEAGTLKWLTLSLGSHPQGQRAFYVDDSRAFAHPPFSVTASAFLPPLQIFTYFFKFTSSSPPLASN